MSHVQLLLGVAPRRRELADICAALESDDGYTTRDKYVQWFDAYTPSSRATEFWDIRNGILHQGTSRRATRLYKFAEPSATGEVARKQPSTGVTVLDVGALAKEMEKAIARWFVDLQQPASGGRLENVFRNLPSLVTVEMQRLPTGQGREQWFSVTNTRQLSRRTF